MRCKDCMDLEALVAVKSKELEAEKANVASLNSEVLRLTKEICRLKGALKGLGLE